MVVAAAFHSRGLPPNYSLCASPLRANAFSVRPHRTHASATQFSPDHSSHDDDPDSTHRRRHRHRFYALFGFALAFGFLKFRRWRQSETESEDGILEDSASASSSSSSDHHLEKKEKQDVGSILRHLTTGCLFAFSRRRQIFDSDRAAFFQRTVNLLRDFDSYLDQKRLLQCVTEDITERELEYREHLKDELESGLSQQQRQWNRNGHREEFWGKFVEFLERVHRMRFVSERFFDSAKLHLRRDLNEFKNGLRGFLEDALVGPTIYSGLAAAGGAQTSATKKNESILGFCEGGERDVNRELGKERREDGIMLDSMRNVWKRRGIELKKLEKVGGWFEWIRNGVSWDDAEAFGRGLVDYWFVWAMIGLLVVGLSIIDANPPPEMESLAEGLRDD